MKDDVLGYQENGIRFGSMTLPDLEIKQGVAHVEQNGLFAIEDMSSLCTWFGTLAEQKALLRLRGQTRLRWKFIDALIRLDPLKSSINGAGLGASISDPQVAIFNLQTSETNNTLLFRSILHLENRTPIKVCCID